MPLFIVALTRCLLKEKHPLKVFGTVCGCRTTVLRCVVMTICCRSI